MSKYSNVTLNWENKDDVLLKLDDNKNPVWGKYEDIIKINATYKTSYGHTNKDIFNDNMFIKGDNLYSLKYLEERFTKRIKCIYIDPPFNTGKIFDHYADGLEKNLWLSMMKIRLELLKNLLTEDGMIFVHIDDDEMPYLKVLMDEIFDNQNSICGNGNNSSNHIATIVWQKKYAPQNDAKFFSDVHDFILVYAKDKKKAKINRIERNSEQNDRYKNLDDDPRGPWTSSDLTVKTPNKECLYNIQSPSGKVFIPSQSRSWGITEEKFHELLKDNRIWFGNNNNSMPRLKRFLSEVSEGIVPKTIWTRDEVGDNSEGKKEIKRLFKNVDAVFTTPKPERLLQRIISLASDEGDWILDAFLGSGTTCAVAQKLNRKWIGLENGDQINSICIPRLESVINGVDYGGVTKDAKWSGGGGFNYFEVES